MVTGSGREIVGVYDVPEKEFRQLPPHEGFERALQNALDQVEGDEGEEFDATVELQARIRVYRDERGADPGHVGQYRVIVKEGT